MAHRDFSASIDEARKNRPTFTLQGVDLMCKPGLHWKALAPVLEQINDADDTDLDALEAAFTAFFDTVLVKSARPKMHELLSEPDQDDDDAVPVSIKQLGDIVRWLIEEYTGVPTEASSDSSTPDDSTGDASKGTGSTPEPALTSV